MFHEDLQIKIRESGQTNLEFARNSGVKKKLLDKILSGEIPDKWTMQRLSKAIGIEIEEIAPLFSCETKNAQLPCRKIEYANLKNKPKSTLIAKGRFCIRCFFTKKEYVYNGIEMAHYTGFRQMAFGKGRGVKVPGILKCPLCGDCHKYFDQPSGRKSVELSEDFLFYISLFIAQEFEKNNIIINK